MCYVILRAVLMFLFAWFMLKRVYLFAIDVECEFHSLKFDGALRLAFLSLVFALGKWERKGRNEMRDSNSIIKYHLSSLTWAIPIRLKYHLSFDWNFKWCLIRSESKKNASRIDWLTMSSIPGIITNLRLNTY